MKNSTIFKLVALTGFAITIYMVARKTPEAQERKAAALEAKRQESGNPNVQLTLIESAKAQAGAYVPALASGLLAVGGVVGSEFFDQKDIQIAKKAFSDYKQMTDKIAGPGTTKFIEKAIDQKTADEKKNKPWEKKETFRIVFQDQMIMFESTRADVIEAIYEINRYFHGRGIITFNEILQHFGQVAVKGGDDRGYESYIGETMYGYSWIDFGLKECPDEPWVTEIYMAVYPHPLNEEEAEEELNDDIDDVRIVLTQHPTEPSGAEKP